MLTAFHGIIGLSLLSVALVCVILKLLWKISELSLLAHNLEGELVDQAQATSKERLRLANSKAARSHLEEQVARHHDAICAVQRVLKEFRE
jgi:hypothetical protein